MNQGYSNIKQGLQIVCSEKAEHHSGTLRKVNGKWVCQECWARDMGIEVKHSKGRPICCPNCNKELMTKFRGGKISISSIKMTGKKAILTCECGYEKVIHNPFGKRTNRDESARQVVINSARERKVNNASK